ncbi:DNA repair protein RecO [Candidatus Aerophobetes bacterium]|nr:DNA repair protein RecO [Candidatus Aerophobetes bacterium]
MQILKTQAITLKNYDFLEQDKIVILYTLEYGMIRTVARGARRIKSRFSVACHFPCFQDVLIYSRGDFSRMGNLTDCRVRYLFPGIRKDIFKFAYACYIAEILLFSIKEGEVNRQIFFLLLGTLSLIDREKRENLRGIVCLFKARLLSLLGYALNLGRCVECGREREKFEPVYFSPQKGGIICPECGRKETGVVGVPREVVLVLDYLVGGKRNLSRGILQKTEKQINPLLDACFFHHLGKSKSLSYQLIENLEKGIISEGRKNA